MAATEAIGPGAAFKDEGNEFFKQGEHLKAAASYTKAIKAEPLNHVYYSNRSQAFLKLSKITKAVEDADKCIQLAPDFVKGYHRKAAALAALNDEEKKDEACTVLLCAIDRGLDSNELVRLGLQIKGKAFAAQVAARRKGEPEEEKKENEEPKKTEPAAKKVAPAKAPAAEGRTAPESGLPWTAESLAGTISETAVCS
jgi:tetratricopeptide (TPR) repeat protein